MRVLLDATAVPANPVGAGVYIIELARHVAPLTDLHLATRRNDHARWADIAPNAMVHAVAPTARPRRLLWEQTGARALVRTTTIDVWHGPHYTLPLRVDVPTVVTVHDMTLIEHPEWHERSKVWFFGRMMRAAIQRASVIVAVSEYTATRVREVFAPAAPVVAIPHGVDHGNFAPGVVGDAGDLARLETFGIRPPYVAFTGTHEPRKNIPGLIDAFARIAPAHPELTLVLGGPAGWGAEGVDRAIAEHRIADRVLRPGRLPYDVLPAFFRQAEVLAYPSFNEGFGLPALEGMASGAVVLSTSGSAVETFAEDAAYLIAPGDTDALSTALDTLIGDDALRSRLRARGPVVAAPYTWERSAALHAEAYTQVAATT